MENNNNKAVAQHWFTLRFRHPAVELRYTRAHAAKVVRSLRLALAIGGFLAVVAWLTHDYLMPERYQVGMNMPRFAGRYSLLAGIVLAGSYAPLFVRRYQLSAFVLTLVMTVALIGWMSNLPADIRSFRALLFILFTVFSLYTVYGLQFPWAVAAGWTVEAMYLGWMGAHDLLEPLWFARHFWWITAANIWGMFVCRQLDRAARREFLAQLRVEEERARSDRVLFNTLPGHVAQRLKGSEEAIAEQSDAVTVLFADLVGFTPLAARKSPREIVELLNRVFTEFDALAQRHGLEKVKTIGDAYMAVAGLPQACDDHAERAARMALAMLARVRQLREETGEPLQLRIGLHSGPVVAGVIGRTRFAYDMWGDTVNTASRMEALGVPDQVQCTSDTASLLDNRAFSVQPRGRIDVKGKGDMETFLVSAA